MVACEVRVSMQDTLHLVGNEGRNALVACILLSLFIGSVTYEVVSLNPKRRAAALVAAIAAALLMFFLLTLLVR